MKFLLFGAFSIFFTFNLSYGQDEYLHLDLNCNGVKSIFTKAKIIDTREADQLMGFVQKGGFNRLAKVKFFGNFGDSISTFFTSKDTIEKQKNELAIILNEFFISEKTDGMSETGKERLALRIFLKTGNNKFQELLCIDTIYYCSAMDVTKKLLRSVSDHFCEIANQSFQLKINDTINHPEYSLNELHHLDSLEKLNIPMYNIDKPKKGIYVDFKHFLSNTPDSSDVVIDGDNPDNVKAFVIDKITKKKKRISDDYVFAVSDGNMILKGTSIGFYQLKKWGSDFYFAGITPLTNQSNAASWAGAFGLTGAAIALASKRNNMIFRFKVSYLYGNSIPLGMAVSH